MSMQLQFEPDFELVSNLFDYDPDSGNLYWRENRGSNQVEGQIAGSLNNNGYVTVDIDGQGVLVHRIAWLLYYGKWPDQTLDHIDRDRANNKILNLRELSFSENAFNANLWSHNKSGIRGVSYDKVNNKWRATIKINQIQHNLGRYYTKEEATSARKQAEIRFGVDHLTGRVK